MIILNIKKISIIFSLFSLYITSRNKTYALYRRPYHCKKIWLDAFKKDYLREVAMSLVNKEHQDKMLTKKLIVQWEKFYSKISQNIISGSKTQITTNYPSKIFSIYFNLNHAKIIRYIELDDYFLKLILHYFER